MAYRRFRKIYVDNHDYYFISSKIKSFIRAVVQYYDISQEQLRYHHYIEYCKDELNYKFGNIYEQRHLSGLTVIQDNKVRIAVTSHVSICKERINFSTLHEIVYSIAHRDPIATMQKFASASNSLNPYQKKEDIIMEVEADICASFLMINDCALIDALKKGETFKELQIEFSASRQCVATRLMNFLIYNVNERYETAQHTLFNYKNDIFTLEHLFPERLGV